MKLEKLPMLLLVLVLGFTSCESDDDNGEDLLPQQEQNELDDLAIIQFLNDHYFNEVGKVVAFDDDDTADDNEVALIDMAQSDESGYWTVKRPDYNANGRQLQDPENDSILIQYDLRQFKALSNNDSVYYTAPTSASNTINTSGYPIWDPAFYYKDVTDLDSGSKSNFEIEGIQEGLKHFYSADKVITDLPAVDFQGLIIIPSRLAYGRESNVLGLDSDRSLYLNFQLYQVIDRE